MKILVVFVLITASCMGISGCASTSEMDAKYQSIRLDMQADLKREVDRLTNEYKRDIQSSQQSLHNELNTKQEIVVNSIDTLKQTHQKDIKEINATLIDVQKDFFQNRRVTEDNARRVYILESLIAATRSVTEEKVEGEILTIRDNQVTTSLGAKFGIKAGDKLMVYKDSSSRDSIGIIQIIVAESNQSSGEVLEKSIPFSRGNIVKLQK